MSFDNEIFTNISRLERGLNFRSVKHKLIASDIANMDTPNYKSFDLILKEETDGLSGPSSPLSLEKTHPDHLDGEETPSDSVGIRRFPPEPYSLRGDGNTVNIDREMARMAENTLVYAALAQTASKEFQLITSAIEER